MFGYVRPWIDELKVREAVTYRAYYCGVCKKLGKSCGAACRLALQHDFATLALAMDEVFASPCAVNPSRCAVNPLRRLPAASGAAVSYAADAHGILLLAKALDDKADGSARGLLFAPPLKLLMRDAAAREQGLYQAMLAMLAAQREAEQTGAGVDAASHPFAEFCQRMFAPEEAPPRLRDALGWLGYNLGKWIGMADALDDFEKDKKKRAFNLFHGCASREDAVAFALPLMHQCAQNALAAWELVPQRDHHAIVGNVLAEGLMETAARIAEGKGAAGKRNGR